MLYGAAWQSNHGAHIAVLKFDESLDHSEQ